MLWPALGLSEAKVGGRQQPSFKRMQDEDEFDIDVTSATPDQLIKGYLYYRSLSKDK